MQQSHWRAHVHLRHPRTSACLEAAAKDAVAKGIDVPDNRVAVKNSSLLSVVEGSTTAGRVKQKTKDNYRSMCNSFMQYWTPDTPIHAIDAQQIRKFFIHAQDDLGYKPSTLNHKDCADEAGHETRLR